MTGRKQKSFDLLDETFGFISSDDGEHDADADAEQLRSIHIAFLLNWHNKP